MTLLAVCGVVVLVVRPACPVYAMFHVLCPGCGGTRALLALLRGDWAAAWRMNALVACAIPMGLISLGLRGRFSPARGLVWVGLAVVVLFTVGRNASVF